MLKTLATLILLLGVIECQSEDDYYDYDDGENSSCECSDESVMDKNSGEKKLYLLRLILKLIQRRQRYRKLPNEAQRQVLVLHLH